jgi:NAD(P)-dependent dehydrogenase (short-subunit alcohol dehydrogenase family)
VLEEMLAEPRRYRRRLRGDRRLAQEYRPHRLPAPTAPMRCPEGAAWLITGGFGGIGLTWPRNADPPARRAHRAAARRPLPARADWDAWLRDHPAQEPTARRIRAVQRLEALGGEVIMVAAADVCNIEEMRAAIDAATARFGPLHG